MTLSLILQPTELNKTLEANPYYDYIAKGWDFAIKYNAALLDASSKAFETFFSTRVRTVKK